MADELKFTEPKLGNEDDAAFIKAVDVVLSTGKKDYPSVVGGLNVASGITFDVYSPIDRSIIFGSCQESEKGLTDRAVVVAKDAFKKWSKTSSDDRIRIFQGVIRNIRSQRFRLAAMVAVSVGMTKECALNEVDRLIDVMSEACDDIKKVKGKPIGVWAILTSFNSPLVAPIGYATAAIIAGNTIVMVPSAHSILPIDTVFQMMVSAGLPDGVFNIILDRRGELSSDLANNLDVLGVVASGSGDRMEDLMFLQTDDELRFINEIKGMNPILIYKPNDVKSAARTVIDRAFRFSGQRIDSCSKIVLVEGQQESFINALIAEAKAMNITDPTELESFTGPIISGKKLDLFKETVDSVLGNVIFGGKVVKNGITENGFYVTPAIVVDLEEDADLNNMDSTLPILSVQVVSDIETAIDVVNCTECGTSAGIITKDDTVAARFKKEVIADQIFINDPKNIIGAAHKAKVENFIQ